MIKHLVIMALSTLISSAVYANSCPNLRGIYACPAVGAQPAYTLKAKQSNTVDDETLYKHYYSFIGAWIPTLASDAGQHNPGGYIAQCVSYLGHQSMLFYAEGEDPATQGTYNFINDAGDYEADVNGSAAIICTRM